jgi:transposase
VLDSWRHDAAHRDLPSFISLARGIEADRGPVAAALTLPGSTGPVQGQVNRVKLIKRRGDGRATLDLLRRRILAA